MPLNLNEIMHASACKHPFKLTKLTTFPQKINSLNRMNSMQPACEQSLCGHEATLMIH